MYLEFPESPGDGNASQNHKGTLLHTHQRGQSPPSTRCWGHERCSRTGGYLASSLRR